MVRVGVGGGQSKAFEPGQRRGAWSYSKRGGGGGGRGEACASFERGGIHATDAQKDGQGGTGVGCVCGWGVCGWGVEGKGGVGRRCKGAATLYRNALPSKQQKAASRLEKGAPKPAAAPPFDGMKGPKRSMRAWPSTTPGGGTPRDGPNQGCTSRNGQCGPLCDQSVPDPQGEKKGVGEGGPGFLAK